MPILDQYGHRFGEGEFWAPAIADELRRIAMKPSPWGPIIYGPDGRLAPMEGKVVTFTRYERLPLPGED